MPRAPKNVAPDNALKTQVKGETSVRAIVQKWLCLNQRFPHWYPPRCHTAEFSWGSCMPHHGPELKIQLILYQTVRSWGKVKWQTHLCAHARPRTPLHTFAFISTLPRLSNPHLSPHRDPVQQPTDLSLPSGGKSLHPQLSPWISSQPVSYPACGRYKTV